MVHRSGFSIHRAKLFAATRPGLSRLALLAAAGFLLSNFTLPAIEPSTFSRKDRWNCRSDISYMRAAASLELYEPGHSPASGWPDGWFDRFFGPRPEIVTLWAPAPTVVSHDYHLFGSDSYYSAGVRIVRIYWLNLPFPGPILSALALLPLIVWTHAYLRYLHRAHNRLCLHCGYNLRAHHPGQKCPECGTPIAGRLP